MNFFKKYSYGFSLGFLLGIICNINVVDDPIKFFMFVIPVVALAEWKAL